jgi:glycosyltransferase involved in cell wall biosynthesis
MKPWHGVADLLDAFARTCAPPGEPAPVLLLVGAGPEEEALRRRAMAPDLTGRVEFTGAQAHDAIPALVRRFDVAVAPYRAMPSFYFHPLKIVEYLAAGVPVVYSDQGDLRELVGAAGLAYPPGECDELAGRLTALLHNHVLRRELAQAAERRGGEFDWRRIAERVLEFAFVPDSGLVTTGRQSREDY